MKGLSLAHTIVFATIAIGLLLLVLLVYHAYGSLQAQISQSPVDAWSAFGEVLQGVGAIAVAFCALVGGAWAFHTYQRSRAWDRNLREQELQAEVVALQGTLADALVNLRSTTDDAAEKEVFREQIREILLLQAELLNAVLRGNPAVSAVRGALLVDGLSRLTRAEGGEGETGRQS
jgi:hypothetical protein